MYKMTFLGALAQVLNPQQETLLHHRAGDVLRRGEDFARGGCASVSGHLGTQSRLRPTRCTRSRGGAPQVHRGTPVTGRGTQLRGGARQRSCRGSQAPTHLGPHSLGIGLGQDSGCPWGASWVWAGQRPLQGLPGRGSCHRDPAPTEAEGLGAPSPAALPPPAVGAPLTGRLSQLCCAPAPTAGRVLSTQPGHCRTPPPPNVGPQPAHCCSIQLRASVRGLLRTARGEACSGPRSLYPLLELSAGGCCPCPCLPSPFGRRLPCSLPGHVCPLGA